jgi:hypothetical protein
LFRFFLLSTLVSLVVSALIGIVIFLMGEFGDTQVKLLLTTLAIGGFSLTGLANALRGGSLWFWALRPIGGGVSMIALLLVALQIWGLLADERATWQAIGTAATLAVTLAHLSLLGIFQPRTNLVFLWWAGAIAASIGLAAMVIVALYQVENALFREYYLRLLGVMAILDVLGTIGLAPLSRLAPGRSAKPQAKPPARRTSRRTTARSRRRPVTTRGR